MNHYDPDAFLTGGGIKSAFGKDDPVGTTITGVICEDPEVRQQTDIQTGVPLTWENGDPKLQLVVTLQTDQRDDEDDDSKRRVYVKGSKATGSKSMHDAVATAVRNASARGLERGGTLTVRLVGSEPSKTRGFSDRKLWEATYKAPDKAAQTGDFLGTTPADIAAAQSAAAPAAPAAAGPNLAEIETAKSLIAAGLDDAVIATSCPSLPATVIQALRNAAAA